MIKNKYKIFFKEISICQKKLLFQLLEEIHITIVNGLKKNGFKFDRSSRKWIVEHLPIEHAEDFASYCRKYGLTFERSDRVITEFDYADYLWDGQRDDYMKPLESVDIPTPKNKI